MEKGPKNVSDIRVTRCIYGKRLQYIGNDNLDTTYKYDFFESTDPLKTDFR